MTDGERENGQPHAADPGEVRGGEEELERQARWLGDLLSGLGDAVIGTDARCRVTYMNAVAAAVTGWPAEGCAGRPLMEVFNVIDEQSGRPVENPAARALLEGPAPGRAERAVLISRDGTERAIEESAAPMRGAGGEVLGCVVVFRDVTERRKADDAVARLASIVESSDDAIVSKGIDGVIRTWNHGAEAIYGYTAAEAIGQHISFIIPPERWEEEEEVLARLRRGERVEHFETERRTRDGRLVRVSLTVSPLRDSAGRVVGASKVARDITQRRHAEEEREALLASERTARAEAEKAAILREEFLATLAHELRNPLAPIRNAIEILRLEGGQDGQARAGFEMIERQINQMVRLVDDLLDASRFTQGKVALRRTRVELSQVIRQVIDAATPTTLGAGHELAVSLPPGPVYLDADPVRLTQVFGNLVNNACKFTGAEGRISVAAKVEGPEVVVTVKDNGVGIPPQMLTRVFDMFAQVDQSLERSRGGLGIGLSLVKSLVNLHGGSVAAFSQGLGTGTEVVVRLPLSAAQGAAAPAAPTPPAEAPEPVGRASAAAGAGLRRILVVDDNRDAALSLARLLSMSGFETFTAHDGEEAVREAELSRPDIVLLDIGLPKLNGYEAARRIRAQAWGRGMLLVALTGWGRARDRQRSADAGFDAHMVKPLEYDALMKFIAEAEGVERRVPAPETREDTAPPAKARKLVHDLRNCLAVMRLTVGELHRRPENPQEIHDAQKSLREDLVSLGQMILRVDELVGSEVEKREPRGGRA